MSETLLKVSSITYAFKARDFLKSKGIKAYIEREAKFSPDNGCGYVLNIPDNADRAYDLLVSNGIRVLGRSTKEDGPL